MLLMSKKRKRSIRFHVILLIIFLFILIFKITFKLNFSIENQIFNCSIVCSYSSQLTIDKLQFDSSHIIRHFPEFVCAQNFRNLADWVFGWPEQFNEDFEKRNINIKVLAPCLPSGSIIYVSIWMIDSFFDQIYPNLINNFVLITGEGDLSSPNNLEYLQKNNSKIIHWFGQNGQYHPSITNKFTHIPIGIHCYEMAHNIKKIYSKLSHYTIPSIYNDQDEPKYYIQPLDVSYRALTMTIPKKDLLLINFNIWSEQNGLRAQIWNTFCPEKSRKNFTFVTCRPKAVGVQMDKLSNIYEYHRRYPFWLSPPGNGIDCHRTWEALYLDIIPIVWNSTLNILYKNLPVLIINNYEELNETFLYQKLNEISKNKLSKHQIYQYEKLRHAYWRRLILKKSRHNHLIDVHYRTNQCWRAKLKTNWKDFFTLF